MRSTSTEAPLVGAARTALGQLPPGWVDEAFTADVVRYAHHQAALEAANAVLAAADQAVAAAVSQYVDGDPTAASLQALADAVGRRESLTAAVRLLPGPVRDPSVVAATLGRAMYALMQAQPPKAVRPASVAEMEAWRAYPRSSSGALAEPPVVTDADRTAEAAWRDADGQVSAWFQYVETLRDTVARATSDPVGVLAAVAGYRDRAAAISDLVGAANAATAAADERRRLEHLTWKAPR